MIKGGYFFKGMLGIMVGVITLTLSFIYLYYYFSNKQGKIQEKRMFGPTPIIAANLSINIILFIMAISFVFIYIRTAKEEHLFGIKMNEVC